MADEDTLQQMRMLISTAPPMRGLVLTSDDQIWLAQARAEVRATKDVPTIVEFDSAMHGMRRGPPLRVEYYQRIMQCLYNTVAMLERNAPASLRGAFLPAGNAFDALVAVGKVLATPTKNVLFADPYAGVEILETYAIQAADKIEIRILADAASAKPNLKAAVIAWKAQHKNARPVEARLAPPRTLHDRAIIVDSAEVWIVGQSFNALAARSPTTISKLDDETSALKADAYADIWNKATPL